MGLYIKNLKMSEHCMDCPFMVSRDNDDCILQSAEANENFENWEQMKAGCPLIEVPEPHGRLIDENEMFVEFVVEGQRSKRYKLGEKWELNGEEIRSVISRLPTIIPASEEGKAK